MSGRFWAWGLAGAAVLAVVIVAVWAWARREDDEGYVDDMTKLPDNSIAGSAVALNRVEKIDTRLDTRREYHSMVFRLYVAAGLSRAAAGILTAHASKAQRGWRSPNPGKCWCYSFMGIKAFPEWQRTRSYFVAGGNELGANGYYSGRFAWRAYPSFQACAEDFLHVIRGTKWQQAYAALGAARISDMGQAIDAYAAGLKAKGYYTATFETWATSVQNIWRNIVRPDLKASGDWA